MGAIGSKSHPYTAYEQVTNIFALYIYVRTFVQYIFFIRKAAFTN